MSRRTEDDGSTFVVATFATYRLVRLALTDTIFDKPRDWLYAKLAVLGAQRDKRKAAASNWVFDLVTCQWCLGVWFAGVLTAALARSRGWPVIKWFVWWMGVAGAQSAVHVAEDATTHLVTLLKRATSDR